LDSNHGDHLTATADSPYSGQAPAVVAEQIGTAAAAQRTCH
jgi:hypothetical protein